MAENREHDFGQSVEAAMSPKLAWIAREKIRAGYNYNASLESFQFARKCGLNAIFSRLEIANSPSGDVGLRASLSRGKRKPDALVSFELIEPSSRLAKQLGLHWFYMLDLAASRGNYHEGIRGHTRRYNNGRLFAPTDNIYWTRVVENRFLRVAKMLQDDPFQIDGFLIDTEMYSLGGATPPGLDYGDYALGEFVKEKGLKVEFRKLSIPERQEWVKGKRLEGELEKFQFDRIEALARQTREKVQAFHPDALFGFFLWRDSFWFRAAAAGFATARTPCLVGPESTYPGGYSDDFLDYQDHVRRKAGVPILFVPGLALGLPSSPGRLKVLPGNLFHRSIRSQGYWFWSLSRLGNVEQRKPFLELLGSVNSELDHYLGSHGEYRSPLRPAPLPMDIPAHLQDTLLRARSWLRLPKDTLPTDPPAPSGMGLRGLHTFVFKAEKGDEAKFVVKNRQLGRYISPTAVMCFRPDGSKIQFDNIPLNQSSEIAVKVDASGAWVFAATSHNNAYFIEPQESGAVLYSPRAVGGCGGKSDAYRYFFYVPKETEAFHLRMGGSQHESASFRLFAPNGQQILEEKNQTKVVKREIKAPGLAGRVCWLEITDIVEDHSFELLDIPNVFAARPEQLLAPEL
ncbi:MAG: hypothetical protein QF473_13175 [Planctomycetota bacterium]|nr:hypothetical protein [Planctomycetota bacterium]